MSLVKSINDLWNTTTPGTADDHLYEIYAKYNESGIRTFAIDMTYYGLQRLSSQFTDRENPNDRAVEGWRDTNMKTMYRKALDVHASYYSVMMYLWDDLYLDFNPETRKACSHCCYHIYTDNDHIGNFKRYYYGMQSSRVHMFGVDDGFEKYLKGQIFYDDINLKDFETMSKDYITKLKDY